MKKNIQINKKEKQNTCACFKQPGGLKASKIRVREEGRSQSMSKKDL